MKNLFFISFLILAFISCQKWRSGRETLSIQSTKVEAAFDEMTNISDQAVNGELVYYKSGTVVFTKPGDKPILIKTSCNVVITLDTLTMPYSLTVDWGSTNCDCNDGKTRRGKIVTTFTGPYLAQGTVITHTPVNYYVNDIQIEGTRIVENMGQNASGQPYFDVEVDGLATFPTGETLSYLSSRVRTWIAGFTTPLYRFDDQYQITGTAYGSHSNGYSYTAAITNPLQINVGCARPVSGTIELTPSGLSTRIIDYGNGTCDITFTVTVNGNTYTYN